MNKRTSRVLATAGMTLALAAISCAITAPEEAEAAKKVNISLNKKKCTLEVGKKITLKAKVKPAKKKKKVTFSTSNKKVASVSKKGVVKAKKIGSAKITAKIKGTKKKAVCKVTVVAKTAPTPAKPSTPTPSLPTNVAVTSITLDKTSVTMYAGSTEQLAATILPANATNKYLTWSSSDSKIASVSGGLITAYEKGTAVITVENIRSGKSATCMVNVKDEMMVTSQSELNKALANDRIKAITIQTNSEETFIIPESNHSGKQIVFDAPNATLTSGADLDEIVILGGNYTQTAGATNCVVATDANVTIMEDASSNITVNEPATQVNIVNDGIVPAVNIYAPAKVRISGSATDTITLSASKPANIVTNQPVNASFTDKITLSLLSGAEDSIVSVDKAENKPDIRGLGYIEVSYKDGTATETVVPGQLAEEDAIKVNVTGTVKDAYSTSNALADVTIYLVADTVDLDIDDTASNVENNENALVTTTDENGAYAYETIPIGNYCLIAKKDGYTTAIQRFSVTSNTGDFFTNDTLYLLDDSVTDNNSASITGTVKNATNNETISELTVQLFLHKGNTVGTPIATTTTDSDGAYTFTNLPAQQYTVQVVGNDDFISNKKSVCVTADSENNEDILVSPKLSGEGVRFVLTWGDYESGAPDDLDAHLIGPSVDGNTFEVYYSSQTFGLDNIIFAQLDVDDMEFEGPETITLNAVVDGTYTFYVDNYSETPDFSFSGAQVNVYQGSELISTYNAPAGTPEDVWKVCTYNSITGRFRGIGKYLTNAEYREEVGDDPVGGTYTSIDSISLSDNSYLDYYLSTETNDDNERYARIEIYGNENVTYESIKDKLQITLQDSSSTYEIIDKGSDKWNEKYSDLDHENGCVGIVEIQVTETLTTQYRIYFWE